MMHRTKRVVLRLSAKAWSLLPVTSATYLVVVAVVVVVEDEVVVVVVR